MNQDLPSISGEVREQIKNGKGCKDDKGKPDLTLLDPRFLEKMALVMKKGADKYERGNWQLDLEPERILAALLRHVFAIQKGETLDKESGLPHTAHIGCNAMFLDYYERHGRPIFTEHDKG